MSEKPQVISCDILIVGAGIAGSAFACAIRNHGYSVVQVEMSTRPLDTWRGDHLQCAVVDILDRWSALPAFWQAGAEKRHVARYVTDRSELILEVDYESLDVPHPYYLYLHHELIAATFLRLAAENSQYLMLRPVRAVAFVTDGDGIHDLTVRLPHDAPTPEGFAPGQEVIIRPRMVVGADGRSSRVRAALGFSFDQYDYECPIVIQFAPRLTREIDPRNVFTLFMGPSGSISRIPRAFGQWKIGLTIDKADISFWKTATREIRQAAVGAMAPEMESLDLKLGGFYAATLLNTHHWTSGNTVLIGDACHAMHPARGQGMNVAIRCVDKLVSHLPPPERIGDPLTVAEALVCYERLTKPAIDAVLAENHALAIARDKLEPEPLARFISQLRAIQSNPARLRRYCHAAAGYDDVRG